MRYVKVFVISAPLLAIFYHTITINNEHPIHWWPDAVIMGFFMGILATLVSARLAMLIGPNLRRRLKRAFTRRSA
jgi:hypothetical protein